MLMRIQERRKEKGLTQAELATLAGVSQSTVAGWETESYLPKAKDIPLLAKILGCTIDQLFASDGQTSA